MAAKMLGRRELEQMRPEGGGGPLTEITIVVEVHWWHPAGLTPRHKAVHQSFLHSRLDVKPVVQIPTAVAGQYPPDQMGASAGDLEVPDHGVVIAGVYRTIVVTHDVGRGGHYPLGAAEGQYPVDPQRVLMILPLELVGREYLV